MLRPRDAVMLIGLMAAYVEAQGLASGFEMAVIAEAMRNAPPGLQAFVFWFVFAGMAVKVLGLFPALISDLAAVNLSAPTQP